MQDNQLNSSHVTMQLEDVHLICRNWQCGVIFPFLGIMTNFEGNAREMTGRCLRAIEK